MILFDIYGNQVTFYSYSHEYLNVGISILVYFEEVEYHIEAKKDFVFVVCSISRLPGGCDAGIIKVPRELRGETLNERRSS